MQSSNNEPILDASTALPSKLWICSDIPGCAPSQATETVSPECKLQLDLYKERFLSILCPEQPEQASILAYAQMMLKKFPRINLEPHEVCHEAYLRGYQKVKKGLIIENYSAWFKRVIFNIIREYSQKHTQLIKLQQKYQLNNNLNLNMYHDTVENADVISRLYDLLDKLEPKVKKILKLQIIYGLSYKEIMLKLVADGDEEMADKKLEDRLRKQVSRTLQNLRKSLIENQEQ